MSSTTRSSFARASKAAELSTLDPAETQHVPSGQVLEVSVRAWSAPLLLLASGALVACGNGTPMGTPDAGVIEIVGDDDARQPSDCPERACFSALVHDCVCVAQPRTEATRTSCGEITTSGGTARNPEDDFCVEGATGTAPDLSCFTTGRRMSMPSRDVTLHGVVDVFGNGPDADRIVVEVYREGTDGMLGEMIGTATASITSPCAETEIEIENMMPTGDTRQLGFYAIENVPTETPLIVVTRPSPGDEGLWKDLYTYNIVLLDDEVVSDALACDGGVFGDRVEYRARVLSVSDYRTIPRTAALSAGIPSGHGAIAGEIHDCGDVRLSFAQVGLQPAPEAFTYFTDDADNPLPDVNRIQGTSRLGLYAGLDLPPGPVDVSALGYVDGQVVSLGWYHARIFADSVTSVSLRGLRPHQITTP